MKCLEIARLQDFAPNTPELLGTPGRYSTSLCVASLCNPLLEIPVYGPALICKQQVGKEKGG